MRKEINSKSKRKWIMGGLAAFTSISLLTTGFAVWYVGVNNTKVEQNVNVVVDTANNNSIIFTLTLSSNNIYLEESAAVTSGSIVTVNSVTSKTSSESGGFLTNPLRISYTDLRITYGDTSNFDYDTIEFSIEEPASGETDATYASVKVKEDNNKLGKTTNPSTSSYQRTGSAFTYLEAPKSIKTSTLTLNKNNNSTTLSSQSGSLDFTWGSFFGNKSPATYYNEIFDKESNLNVKAAAADEITAELNAMNNQLNGKTIKLVAKLVKTAN